METARQILAVFFVLALFGAALWALRGAVPLRGVFRRAPRDPERSLQITGRITLTPQHSLHIVRAGTHEWVVATHPQGCTVIREGPAAGATA